MGSFGNSAEKLITVAVDGQGNPTVDQDSVDLLSTSGETCRWVSANIPFRIIFAANTPFAASSFSGPSAPSGAIKPGATGPYKYSVQVGNKILDPRLVIHP
jgi:hypothetical protein